MDFNQLMEHRYSCRNYSDEPLSEAELKELITAANGAPVGSARYMDLHLKATEMGLGSCFAWGVLESERMFPEYAHNELLDLPEDFEPLIGILVGHPAEEGKVRSVPESRLSINFK